MSTANGTPDEPAGPDCSAGPDSSAGPVAPTGPSDRADRPDGPTPAGPRPEPLRLFGTTWLYHDRGYAARRVAAALGSLALTAVSCLVLRFAHEGLRTADTGTFVTPLTVVTSAVCSALAFRHTWDAFGRRPDPERRSSLRGLLAIGFAGSLLAYFIRSLIEAPGEGLHREEYEAARAQHDKRTPRRSGSPRRKHRTPRPRPGLAPPEGPGPTSLRRPPAPCPAGVAAPGHHPLLDAPHSPGALFIT